MWNTAKAMLDFSPGVRRFIATEALLGLGVGIFQLVLNLHLLEMKLDEKQIGEITSVGALLMGLLSIPAGMMAGWAGRKNMFVLGMFLMGVGYAGFGLGETIPFFYASQLVLTLGLTLLVTSEIQLLYQYSRSQREETRAFSMLFAVFTLFVGVGTLLGGYLPKWLGGSTTVYQWTLFVAAIMHVLGALSRGLLLPSEPKPETAPQAAAAIGTAADTAVRARKSKLPSRSVWVLSVFTLLTGMAFGFTGPYLNVIVKFRLDWQDTTVSLLLMAAGFFTFAGSLIMPALLERAGVSKAFALAYAANIVLTLLLCMVFPVYIFCFVLLVRGGGFTLLTNMTESQAMSCIDERERNIFAGMRTVCRSVGTSVASYSAGVILAAKNYTTPFLLTAIVIAAGYLYFLVWVRPLFQAHAKQTETTR
ncbi:MFS transporter [Paenibacillus sp. MBLB4367]|uniref:MFS transporter n=1 Tax=Paenibacillus sp. MBLB4367 TaxID=3384767 RepID=UPI0039080B4A